MAVPLPLPLVTAPAVPIAGTSPPTVAHVALGLVKDRVSSFVPCVPGGNDMPLVEAAQALGYSLLFPRSEAAVGMIANGLVHESGLPTLCLVITSVGVYGLMQALYCASVNERPLVVISGEVGAVGRGCVQAGDGWDGPSVTRMTSPLTAWSVDAMTASQACRALPRAVALAAAERRPVHVNIPLLVQKELCP